MVFLGFFFFETCVLLKNNISLLVSATLQVHTDILPYTEENARKKGVHTLSDLEQLFNKEVRVCCIKHLTATYQVI